MFRPALRFVPALAARKRDLLVAHAPARYPPLPMRSFPTPALAMVEQMQAAARGRPERAIALQGAPG